MIEMFKIVFSVIIGILIGWLGMAGIDYMFHGEKREQSWDEIYKDARTEHDRKSRIADTERGEN